MKLSEIILKNTCWLFGDEKEPIGFFKKNQLIPDLQTLENQNEALLNALIDLIKDVVGNKIDNCSRTNCEKISCYYCDDLSDKIKLIEESSGKTLEEIIK